MKSKQLLNYLYYKAASFPISIRVPYILQKKVTKKGTLKSTTKP